MSLHRSISSLLPCRASACSSALLALAFLASCRSTDIVAESSPGVAAAGRSEELAELYEDAYHEYLRLRPELATSLGDHRHDSRLSDRGPEGDVALARLLDELLERYEAIDAATLDPRDLVDHRLLGAWLRGRRTHVELGLSVFQIDPLHGFHLSLPILFEKMRYHDAEDCDVALERLARVPPTIDGVIASLRRGMESGLTEARPVIDKVLAQLREQVATPASDHPFRRFATSLPDSLPPESRRLVEERSLEIVEGEILPKLRELLAFVEQEYLPSARSEVGIRSVPGGEAIYAFRVREETTTDLSPETIHATGLSEVARIRAEMGAIREAVGFEGDLAAFFTFLRTDPRFYFDDPEALLVAYRDICKRADAELPKLFGKLPRTPYGVVAIPDFAAKSATTAYYNRPTADGTRPGLFYANTYDLRSRPKYEMEALALHEAVPGHHLQLALQIELEGLPKLRTRVMGFTGFVEGWALYTERLGEAMGFYTDPYSDFGRLTYEMWRACRLVVDTGMHHEGWTREQAIDFMLANTALSRLNIESEVDRYIAWPGQALAYKLGELKIRELRSRAEERLGDRFDIRAFHDVVLEQGSIPLDLLEERIERWLANATGLEHTGRLEPESR